MAGPTAIRRIGNPLLALPQAGVRIRTRMHPTGEEAATLTAIGELLGLVFRCALAGRIRLGRLDGKRQALWRADRKQALTRVWSSQRAGAISRLDAAHLNEQQWQACRQAAPLFLSADGESRRRGGNTQNSILLANKERLSHLAPRLRL